MNLLITKKNENITETLIIMFLFNFGYDLTIDRCNQFYVEIKETTANTFFSGYDYELMNRYDAKPILIYVQISHRNLNDKFRTIALYEIQVYFVDPLKT